MELDMLQAAALYQFWSRQAERSTNLDPLLVEPSWIPFRLQARHDKPGFDKIPMTRNGGNMRDVEDENEHSSIREVVEQCCLKYPTHFHGAGFVFSPTNDIVGIDIDYYKLTLSGDYPREIIDVVMRCNTLATSTPSGGVHMYVRLDPLSPTSQRIGHLRQRLLGCIEIYNTSGFFAETLNVVKDKPLIQGDDFLTYILDQHELRYGPLAPAINQVTDLSGITEQDYASVEELLDAASKINATVRTRYSTPHNMGEIPPWGQRLRDLAGDLRKAGGSWPMVTKALMISPLVLHSFDHGHGETRLHKAERLLNSPKWQWRRDVNNIKLANDRANDHHRKFGESICAAWYERYGGRLPTIELTANGIVIDRRTAEPSVPVATNITLPAPRKPKEYTRKELGETWKLIAEQAERAKGGRNGAVTIEQARGMLTIAARQEKRLSVSEQLEVVQFLVGATQKQISKTDAQRIFGEQLAIYFNELKAFNKDDGVLELHTTDKGEPISSERNAAIMLERLYPNKIRFDSFTQRAFIGDKRVDDPTELELVIEIQESGIKQAKKNHIHDAIESVARKNAFNSLTAFLDSLNHDHTPRLDTWLSVYCGAEQNEYTRCVGRWWLMQAVARAYMPGCKGDYVMLFEGRQGTRKSTFWMTVARKEEWYLEYTEDLDTADGKRQLRGKWITALPELAGLTNKEVRRVKAFVTRPHENFRDVYRLHHEDHKRTIVLCGDTNEKDDYMIDATGNRRFWIVEVGRVIDIEALEGVMDQLWAEAVAAFKSGEKYWPVEGEDDLFIKMQEHITASKMHVDIWQADIEKWIWSRDPETKSEEGHYLPSDKKREILPNASWIAKHVLDLNSRDKDLRVARRIGNILRLLGYESKTVRIPGKKPEWGFTLSDKT